MSKCPVCNSRKGKRKCLIVNDFICSLCCGETHDQALCSSCIFYEKPKRKYGDVPSYTTAQMDGDFELESYGNSIEGALCSYDMQHSYGLSDEHAIKIVELLLDKYYFGDDEFNCDSQILLDGANYLWQAIQKDMPEVDKEIITKILGVIRFVAKRRTRTGREYMNIIHRYVGQRIDTGVRLLVNV